MQNYQNYKVDLSNCDREPIHLIGRIQPHGFLLVLNKHSLEVEQVSQNINSYLQAESESLIGSTISVLAAPGESAELEALLLNESLLSPFLVQLQGKRFFGYLHESQGSLVLECEPFEPTSSDQAILEYTRLNTNFLNELNALDTLTEQADFTVRFVQQVIAYDRVMLYRFDEDWHGEVLAEKIKPGIHSYLHHHFPASDIPAQARALLVEKPIRQIADVGAEAVNILPYINPVTGTPSNIIRSELRNPSEIHLEYLQNMGVQATLSISILVNNKLWGIIACQHEQEPVFVNYWKRQLCNNIAQVFANAVLANQEKRDLKQLEAYRQKEEMLLMQIIESGSINRGLFEHEHTLLELTEATGAALYLEGSFYTIGSTPGEVELTKLLSWLTENITERVFHTSELSKVYPEANEIKGTSSGLLALEISKFNKEYLLYFKPEISEKRIWAGNPEKPVNSGTGRIHPRKSFNYWEEIVKGKSMPWSLNELDSTQILLKDLTALILRHQAQNLQLLNSQLRHTSGQLLAKNRRLEDFTHIIAHNLRSPLSNMQGLSDLYSAEPDKETSDSVMQMMRRVINNMATTIDDLHTILQAELEQKLFEQEIELPQIIEKELQNLQSVILETGAEIILSLEVNQIWAPKVYLESIVHNLLSNALKYRSAERVPVITVKSWQEGDNVHLSVSDNGQGMDMNKVGNKLFELYTTFHKNKDAKGMGLYLTKIQAEALGGSISVDSKLGEGTTFTLSLKSQKIN